MMDCKRVTVLCDDLSTMTAAAFIRKANEFEAQLWVEEGGRKVNAKSLLGILSLGIRKHAEITLEAEGRDAEQALCGLAAWVQTAQAGEEAVI